MSLSRRLDVIYADQLRNHPEGHALYAKISADRMGPGTCGFFDEKGDWKTLLRISDSEFLKKEGWTLPPANLKVDSEFGIEWDLKLSESTRGYEVSLDGSFDPGVSVSGGLTVAFKSSKGAGAILVTSPPIECRQFNRDLPALEWVLENTPRLLQEWPEIRERGLWIVTKTYTTKRSANAVLTSVDQEARISVKSKVANVLEAAPTTSWWKHKHDSTWNIYTDDAGVVVFMGGVQCKVGLFRRRELFPKPHHQQHMYRGGPPPGGLIMTVESDAGDCSNDKMARVVPETCGELSSEVVDLIEKLRDAEDEIEDGEDENYAGP